MFNEAFWIMFGYTGSGKTYTTMGVLELLLNECISRSKRNLIKTEVYITAYQIYNEKIYDMFQKNKELRFWKTDKLTIRGLHEKKVTKNFQIL